MPRLTVLLVLLLVLVAAVALLFMQERGEEPTHEGEAAPEPLPAPPALIGRGTPLPAPSPATDATVAPTSIPRPAAAAAAGRTTWMVRGTLRGIDPALPGSVQVSAVPVVRGFSTRAHSVRGPAPEGAAFEIDVSPFFAGGARPSHVEVVVDHPAYAIERTRLDVAAAGGDDPRVLRVEVTLRRANAITGRVVDEAGNPQGSCAVALFAVEDGMPRFQNVLAIQPLDRTLTSKDGTYRLRIVEAGTFFVVAASDRLCPAGRLVDRPPGEDLQVEPLVLRAGFAIEGRVTWRGEGVPGATVRATYRGLPIAVSGGDGSVSWSEGNVVAADRHGAVHEDGTYRIGGLIAGDYRVTAHARPPGVDCVCALVDRRLGRDAVPPATGVDLEVQGVLVRLSVLAEGIPVREAGLQIEAGGMWTTCVTGADGAVVMLLAADVAATLQIRHEGYAPASLEIDPAASGTSFEKEIELVKAPERAELEFVLQGEYASSVRTLSVELAPPDRKAGNFGPPTSVGREDGAFRLPDVEAGRYVVTICPDQRPWHVSGYYLRERQTVDVPDYGVLQVPVAVRLGGRIRIAARDEEGGLLEAACVIRDARGNAVSVAFASHSDAMSMCAPDTLGSLSASLVDPPLKAGRYTVELRMPGRSPRTLDVVVKERETAEIDVVLPGVR